VRRSGGLLRVMCSSAAPCAKASTFQCCTTGLCLCVLPHCRLVLQVGMSPRPAAPWLAQGDNRGGGSPMLLVTRA